MSWIVGSVRKQLVLIALAVTTLGTHVVATAEPRMSSLGTFSAPVFSHMRVGRSTDTVRPATCPCLLTPAPLPPQHTHILNPHLEVTQYVPGEPLTIRQDGNSLGKCYCRCPRPGSDSKYRGNPQVPLHRLARQPRPRRSQPAHDPYQRAVSGPDHRGKLG